MNLLLRGPKNIGKSAIVDAAVAAVGQSRPLALGGFMTYRDPLTEQIYAVRARVPRRCEGGVLLGLGRDGALPGVFDEYARQLLDSIAGADGVVLDELGFLESDSPRFQEAVVRCFDADIPVLAVLKDRPVPWYERLLRRSDVAVFEVTKDNRNALPEELAGMMGAR